MRLSELILTEGHQYSDLLNPVIAYLRTRAKDPASGQSPEWFLEVEQHILARFNQAVAWAKRTIPRKDAAFWYLKCKRAEIFHEQGFEDDTAFKLMSKFTQDTGPVEWGDLEPKLEHFMGLPIPAIREYAFGREEPVQVFSKFKAMEEEWIENRDEEAVITQSHHEVLVDFKDGWVWMNLNQRNCDDEAYAMGHCGNRYGHPGDKLLSLRRKLEDGTWRPSLTFVLDEHGFLGEMKGRANEKPHPKYHEKIIALLMLPQVKGLKGGGHEPENNFDMGDLSGEQRERLYEAKPALMPLNKYFDKFGCDEHFRETSTAAVASLNHDWIHFYKRGWEEVDGEWRFVYDRDGHWTDFVRDFGDKSVQNLVKVYNGDRNHYFNEYQPDIKDVADDILPQAYIDHLWEYVWNECSEDIKDKFYQTETIDDFSEEELWQFIQEEEEPTAIAHAFDYAISTGQEHGYEENVAKELKECLQQFEYLHAEEGPPKGWQLYLTPYTLADVLSDPDEQSKIANNQIQSERLTCNDDRDYSGFSSEGAFNSFKEMAPDGALPEVPEFRDIDTMSFEECKEEYEEMTQQEFDRYVRPDDLSLARVVLERARKRYWGAGQRA